MRHIDLETWSRREHFRMFSAFGYPHFSLCANVDLTAFYPFLKQHGFSFNVATVYLIARAANAIPEFRMRIRAGQVIEHETVHPASTILITEDVFSFCTFDYAQDFSLFAPRAAEQISRVKEHGALGEEPDRDDLLYMTAIPWVSFTSFMHPIDLNPADSVPRFAWGKFFQDGDRLKMPLNVQGHHALMDGIHMGQFYAHMQDYLDHPRSILGGA